MLTGTFNLYGIMDGENANYMQLTCSLPVVSMDENNVQADAAVFRLVEVNGSTQTVIPAWFRLKVMSGNVVLDTIDQTAVRDELSYMLPTDRYGNADKLLVEAYRDDHETEGSYDEKLAELTVPISRRNPIPFPRPEEWSAGLTFRNGEYLMVGNIVYMWRNPVPGNSELPPEQDIEQNPQTTSWVAYQNWPLLATQVFLANFAKVGWMVTAGKYSISQKGMLNGKPSEDYTQFDFETGQGNFKPNLLIDWFSGLLRAMNVDVRGNIEAISGMIGMLLIENQYLGIKDELENWLFKMSFDKALQRFWFEDGDIGHQGTLGGDPKGRSLRFYASDMWVRGELCHASLAKKTFNAPDNWDVYCAVYAIPGYSPDDETTSARYPESGQSVDLILLEGAGNYILNLTGAVGYKMVYVVNNSGNTKRIRLNKDSVKEIPAWTLYPVLVGTNTSNWPSSPTRMINDCYPLNW